MEEGKGGLGRAWRRTREGGLIRESGKVNKKGVVAIEPFLSLFGVGYLRLEARKVLGM